MTVHPRRAVMELFHLKRVHVLVPTDRLGDALKSKLSVLALKPEHLSERSLECLLDCLAYFKLTSVPATRVAVDRARELLPTLKGSSLAAIVGNCTRLEEFSVTLQSAPLLKEAIKTMGPDDIASLAKAFSIAGLSSPDRWALLAEHVIRNVSLFSAEDLVTIVGAMGRQRVDYPDFYAVVERHVSDQPAAYISGSELANLIESFQKANHPVVSLLALSAERTALGLDSGIEAAAASGNDPSSLVVQAFVTSCRRALQDANMAAVVETLAKCDERRVYNFDVLTMACQRVMAIAADAGAVEPSQALSFVHSALHVAKGIASYKPPDEALLALGDTILEVADMSAPLVAVESLRSISLLAAFLHLFGKRRVVAAKRGGLAKALVAHFLAYDSMELMESRQLLRFAMVMHSLADYGGLQVLDKHISMIVVGLPRLLPGGLCVMADILSYVPRAREPKGAFMSVLQALAACKNWRGVLKAHEVVILMQGMSRARLRHNHVLMETVSLLLQQHSNFSCHDLSVCALCAAQLNYKELDFYTVTSSRVFVHPHCTVSDVCRMLYTFTFVVSYVIKAVQEAMPRLRIAAGQATPRDVTLALYSFVKLRVTRHEDVTRALCDQAASNAPAFKPREMLSVLQSLKQLQVSHVVLMEAFAGRVVKERESIPHDNYAAIVAALAGVSKGTLFTPSAKASFVSSSIARVPVMSGAELRDVLVAISAFQEASSDGVEGSDGVVSPDDVTLLIAAAEGRHQTLHSVEDICDVIIALTDLRPDAVALASPLAVRLRGEAMQFMELPRYQQQFRTRGLFRLFPDRPKEDGHGTVPTSKLGAAPTSMLGLAPTASAPEPLDIGTKLKQFHATKKGKQASMRRRGGK